MSASLLSLLLSKKKREILKSLSLQYHSLRLAIIMHENEFSSKGKKFSKANDTVEGSIETGY